jgi:hypothetical protein
VREKGRRGREGEGREEKKKGRREMITFVSAPHLSTQNA